MHIEFPRGDSWAKGFVLKARHNMKPIEDEYDEIYCTVKKHAADKAYLFQKRKSTGGIVHDGGGHYTIYFMPEDTDRLAFGDYDFDVEFVRGIEKRTVFGTLTLTKEVTHVYNE